MKKFLKIKGKKFVRQTEWYFEFCISLTVVVVVKLELVFFYSFFLVLNDNWNKLGLFHYEKSFTIDTMAQV